MVFTIKLMGVSTLNFPLNQSNDKPIVKIEILKTLQGQFHTWHPVVFFWWGGNNSTD